jgi:ATP synthase protein I
VSEGNKPPSPLGQLDEKLREARAKRREKERGRPNGGLGVGMRIAVELAAAIGVGTGIGIVLDRWWGTSPWLLIVFFLVGCVAAFLNVYRVAQEFEKDRKARNEADKERKQNE